MASRKTFKVEDIKQWINAKLANDSYCNMEKYGMINTLDHILSETGNYRGFSYIDPYDADTHTVDKDLRRQYL